MNKCELLEEMKARGACWPAREYVERHPSDDAATIGLNCPDTQWLIWMLTRVGRLERFARVCVRRFVQEDGSGLNYAQRNIEEYRAGDRYGISDAAYATAHSRDFKDESALQLKGLRRIWCDWCAGKPAER